MAKIMIIVRNIDPYSVTSYVTKRVYARVYYL